LPKTLQNVHPGEVLDQEFLQPLGLSQNALARAVGVAPRRINEIVLGKRGISADTALRLARAFGASAEFWMNLQTAFDLEEAARTIGPALAAVEHIAARAAMGQSWREASQTAAGASAARPRWRKVRTAQGSVAGNTCPPRGEDQSNRDESVRGFRLAPRVKRAISTRSNTK
jgi:addiction module HigA family antidote